MLKWKTFFINSESQQKTLGQYFRIVTKFQFFDKCSNNCNHLAKYLEQSAFSETYWYSSVNLEILLFLHVTHLYNQIVNCTQCNKEMLLRHIWHHKKVINCALQLWMVKPGHFYYFCKHYHHHVYYLTLTYTASLRQPVHQVNFYLKLFLSFNLQPVTNKHIFYATSCKILSINYLRVVQDVPEQGEILRSFKLI